MSPQPRITFVCPTRNRPEFIKVSLEFFSKLDCSGVRLLIVDNSSPSNLATEEIVRNSGRSNVDFVRTSGELGMVDNWELALDYSDAEYIGFITDKMFLQHRFLKSVVNLLSSESAEIVSWQDDVYTPDIQGDYFGQGVYVPRITEQVEDFVRFDPAEVLRTRYLASVPRSFQSPRDYSIGKICFGLYSADLISRIRAKHGRLFFPISPDYTSMILALGTAQSGVVSRSSGVLHVNTDLSNGRLVGSSDLAALEFLKTIDPSLEILHDLPVPRLYCSTNNLILNDYRQMMKRLGIPFAESLGNWAEHISNDINSNLRQWSSYSVYAEQHELLTQALSCTDFNIVKTPSPLNIVFTRVFLTLQSTCPPILKRLYRRIRFRRSQRTCKTIFELAN